MEIKEVDTHEVRQFHLNIRDEIEYQPEGVNFEWFVRVLHKKHS